MERGPRGLRAPRGGSQDIKGKKEVQWSEQSGTWIRLVDHERQKVLHAEQGDTKIDCVELTIADLPCRLGTTLLIMEVHPNHHREDFGGRCPFPVKWLLKGGGPRN